VWWAAAQWALGMHYDLAGIWKWPEDVRNPGAIENETIRERMAQGRPWFIDPEKFDEAVKKRDQAYIRRLKALYWSDEAQSVTVEHQNGHQNN
jgi:hypothetical protein